MKIDNFLILLLFLIVNIIVTENLHISKIKSTNVLEN